MHETPAVSKLSRQHPFPVPPDSGNSRAQHRNCRGLTGTWQRISKVGTTGCSGTAVLPAIGWKHYQELGISGSSSSSLRQRAPCDCWPLRGQGQTLVCRSGAVKPIVHNVYGEVGEHFTQLIFLSMHIDRISKALNTRASHTLGKFFFLFLFFLTGSHLFASLYIRKKKN